MSGESIVKAQRAQNSAETLNGTQVKRGLVLLAAFVVLRLVVARVSVDTFGGTQAAPGWADVFVVLGVFLVMSVGLVYFGFTRWVGVDLKAWWWRRPRVKGDVAWGCASLVGLGVIGLTAGVALMVLGITPDQLGVEQPAMPSFGGFIAQLTLGFFFGIAIAAFQEETLFRGFLQGVLTPRVGPWPANLIQATLFSAAHLGIEPIGSISRLAFLLAFRFAFGFLLGWLKIRRGTLLAPGIVHGLVG